jgi:hypothetical protein
LLLNFLSLAKKRFSLHGQKILLGACHVSELLNTYFFQNSLMRQNKIIMSHVAHAIPF